MEISCEKLTKISGYLEKRGKLSLMGRWKKWWCVLEGQLLLYYKSRIEYANLSPCCGSLNMALVKNVQPHVGFQIHIMTHSQLIILRTKNKEKQQQWFHALVGVLPQNSYLSPLLYFSTNPIEYRRKSERKKKKKSKHKAFEEPTKVAEIEHDDLSLFAKSDNDISNLTNESNFSIFENHTLTEVQNISASQDQIQFRATQISTSLECNLQRPNTCVRNSLKCCSEVNIRRYSSYRSVINGVSINDRRGNRRSMSCECVFTQHLTSSSSIEQYNFLSSCSIRSDERSQQNNQCSGDLEESKTCKRTSRRKRKNDSKKYNTMSRRSWSFLRKIFKKKMDNQIQPPVEINSNEEIIEVKHDTARSMTPIDADVNTSESPESDIKEMNTIRTMENDETAPIKIEEITPCDNFVQLNTTNTSSNNETESESSESDTESGIIAIENPPDEQKLPDLPMKNGNCSSFTNHHFKDINSNYPAKITSLNNTDTKESISTGNCASMELDSLLLQLTELNNECDKSHESLEFHNNIIEDPDYDIPRPHTSLISDTGSIPSVYEKNHSHFQRNSNVSNSKYESLSLTIDMAPDSLEMPWLLNDTKCNMNNFWTTKKEFDLCLENDSGSEYDYHDSLNSNKYNS